MKDRVASVLQWWLGEMTALLPWIRGVDPVVALWRGDRFEFWRRAATGAVSLDPGQLPADAPLMLRLAEGKLWHRSFELPRTARRFLRQIVGGEMDRRTPWRADQVYYHAEAEPAPGVDGRIIASLTVLPRQNAASALETLARLGLAPSAIELVEGADPARQGPCVPLSGAAGRNLIHGGRVVQALAGLVAVAVLSVAVQTVWLGILEARLAQARQDVRAVRALAADISRLRRRQDFPHARRQESPAVVAVLDALAQGLPDDSWAESVTLGDGKLALTGQSADATRLLPLIGGVGRFTEVRFDAPVTAAPKGGQNFALSARLTEAEGR